MREFLTALEHLSLMNRTEMLTEKIELDLGNPQLREVRMNYCKPVATRFMENYLKALT